ncbi:hypothetical protein [Paraburkholderia sp. BL17N1]|uniref:hypothetical protein n=1 Tax=Paraburkholderia sp. BL17N1 TaxID=1938798 RepID=UPI000EB2F1D2|nr:hypothetical protein [Paraburkholderia sp. BL17N1]RKR36705.1 hypothetical protein B0G82_4750 [Paraburkholderia sp. BL17N1]
MISLRKSGWSFNTSATGGLGIELLSISGGKIILDDPQKQSHDFSYFGFGIGYSRGLPKIKLPPIPILNREMSGTGSTKDFTSDGVLYMTSYFHRQELSTSDIKGATIYFDGGAGLLAGYGESIMLLGINTELIAPWLVNPGIFANMAKKALDCAPAVLLLAGEAEGLIAGGGLSAMIGHLQ